MSRNKRSLETEATSFLLFTAGLFFSVEGTLHYINFFVMSHAENTVSLILIIGSASIALLYYVLGYSCWTNPFDLGFFAFSLIVSVLLSACFFILVFVEALGSKFYLSAYVSYFQFLSGYGSATIIIELLIVFFSYRVCRALSIQNSY
ncbi:MAG: hypothetical protein JRN20_00770 [Nitrososphaerota archaeon]|jgi:hypothetical protein|nr:hypothetical protein [Nitrososphaerota archaeon]MDG6924284.1 hypothetical protein [Nitrososphaerota archaeon]